MYISRRGLMTDGGVPCALATGLKTLVGAQASFTAYGKLAKRTSTQGECDLCGAGEIPLGVFVDCSPKGDSATVETKGFVAVVATSHGCHVGDLVTTGASGVLVEYNPAATDAWGAAGDPTRAEIRTEVRKPVWQVDEVIDANTLLIQIDALV